MTNGSTLDDVQVGTESIPVVIRAKSPRETPASLVRSRPDLVTSYLRSAGAILFRDFGSGQIDEFKDFIKLITPNMVEYTGGTSPRLKVGEGIFTSTEYPAQYPIALHNEMSYHQQWPDVIYFFCITAAADRGETPIADSRQVLGAIPDSIVSEFEARKVTYIRNLLNSRNSFGSWQKVFGTEDREVVEGFCRERDIALEWRRNGTLRISETRPATRRHPVTGDRVWFNQAHMWHISNSPIEIAATLAEDEFPMTATFGDGGRFDVAVLEEIRRAYREATRMFKWQVGDLLLLDNMLVAHGRAPFSGPRRILVSMGRRSQVDERANAGVP